MNGFGLVWKPRGELRSPLIEFLSLLFILFSSVLTLAVSPLHASEETEIVPGEFIVHYRRSGDRERHQNGRFLRENHKSEAELILEAAGVVNKVYRNGRFYRPLHKDLVLKMRRAHLREPAAQLEIVAALAEEKGNITTRFESLTALVADPPDDSFSRELILNVPAGSSVQEAVANVRENWGFLKRRGIELIDVTENVVIPLSFTPNDSSYSSQYALRSLRAEIAWDSTRGRASDGRRVVIAVIDTGVDYNHPDLTANIFRRSNGQLVGRDFYDGDSAPLDQHGHGTHCSGIAAAATNNNRGIAGMCPECLIMPIRAGKSSFSLSAIKQSILYARDNGADVISMSFGSTAASSMINELRAAKQAGVVLVAAAGNGNSSQLHYPAAYSEVISVASVDSADRRSSFSQYGSWVDVAAPGSSILSTLPGNSYDAWSGTSMAAPYVAGIAGLVLSQENVTASQMQQYLRNKVRVAPGLAAYYRSGFGIVDASQAVVADDSEGIGIPVIETPTGSIEDTTPRIEWSSVLNATGYDVEVERRSTGQVVYVSSASSTSATVSPALPPGDYCSRVRARNANETGQYSSCVHFAVIEEEGLGSPTVTTPTGTVEDTTPLLQWTAVTGASKYDVRVRKVSDQSIVYSRTGLSGRQTTVSPALVAGTYCTEARARNSTETGAYGTCRQFTIEDEGSLGVPTVTAPDGTITDSTPTLRWSAVTGATAYDVSVLRLSDEEVVHSRTDLTSTSSTVVAALVPGSYCTRVRAKNANLLGDYSSCKGFTIQDANPRPPAPEILAPKGTISEHRPLLKWSAVSAVTKYDVELVKKSSNEIVFFKYNFLETEVQSSTYLYAGDYCVRARAWRGTSVSKYSDCEEFTVYEETLATPSITAPKGSISDTTPTFRWTSVSGATAYGLQVRSAGGGVVFGQSNIATTSLVSPVTLNPGQYCTIVRATKGSISSPYSPCVPFVVESDPVPASPRMLSPTGTISDSTPTFRWEEVQHASRYTLVVERNGISVYTRSNISGTQATIGISLSDGSYASKVNAISASGKESGFSAALSFAVKTASSDVTRITAPVAGSTVGSSPEFRWERPSNASSTRLWVRRYGQSAPDINVSVRGTSYTHSTNLKDGTYKFYARSYRGSTAVTPWTSIVFQVKSNEPPGQLSKPVLTSPSGTIIDRTPTFRWNADSRASRHFLHVVNLNLNRAEISLSDIQGSSYTHSSSLRPGRYVVWVRSYGTGVNPSVWSTAVVFEISSSAGESTVLDRPVITSPVGTVSTRPTFRWESDARSEKTYLWVNDESRSISGVIKEYSLSGDSYTPSESLAPGTYRVWIKSTSSRYRASSWSVPKVFVVE